MTIATPQTSQLFAALWDYLDRSEVVQLADVVETHPDVPSQLGEDKGRIVMVEVNDVSDGRFITEAIGLPAIQFSCYHQREQGSRLISEKVMEVMSVALATDLPMTDQQVQQFYREQRLPTRYSDSIGGYQCAVVYRFHLSGK